jgi:hypothetical protein
MARVLKVPAAWLKREADAGRVPCLNADGRYLFNSDAVERVLAERAGRVSYAGDKPAPMEEPPIM